MKPPVPPTLSYQPTRLQQSFYCRAPAPSKHMPTGRARRKPSVYHLPETGRQCAPRSSSRAQVCTAIASAYSVRCIFPVRFIRGLSPSNQLTVSEFGILSHILRPYFNPLCLEIGISHICRALFPYVSLSPSSSTASRLASCCRNGDSSPAEHYRGTRWRRRAYFGVSIDLEGSAHRQQRTEDERVVYGER